MATPSEARVDKWLWAARIYKTRTIADDACKNNRVTINARKPPVSYSFRVIQPIEKRVGAKLLPEILENITAPEQYELLEMSRISGFIDRARGTGRPTKKERRALDDFAEEVPMFGDDFDFDLDD